MSQWNGLDFFIFLIFFLNTMLGMSRGASKEIISMMCLSAALIFTIRFTVPLTAWLNSSPLTGDVVSNRYLQNFMSAIGAPAISTDTLEGLSYSLSLLICFAGFFLAQSRFSTLQRQHFQEWDVSLYADYQHKH